MTQCFWIMVLNPNPKIASSDIGWQASEILRDFRAKKNHQASRWNRKDLSFQPRSYSLYSISDWSNQSYSSNSS